MPDRHDSSSTPSFPEEQRTDELRARTLDGSAGLGNYTPGREGAEIGISIGEASTRGLGLGPAALVAFLRVAWASLAFRRIFLNTFAWNERAWRSFERAGFSEVSRNEDSGGTLIRMEARREWWLLWDGEGRFAGHG